MDGLLIINKPEGWTSHDVVAKLRRILSVQKIGHTGTLDPDATGVLCMCIGKATKLAQYTGEFEKEYSVVMKLGIETDTQDASGRVVKETKDFNVTEQEIEEAFKKFRGRIKQIPPMYSAVKVGGVPLYRLARKGKEVSREPREVYIKDIKLTGCSDALVSFNVICSKGAYIRTLCSDIGNYLGAGAHMYRLERLGSGEFSINDALTIEEVEDLKDSGKLSERLISLEQIVEWMPSVTVNRTWQERVRHGGVLTSEAVEERHGDFRKGGNIRLISADGRLLCIGVAQCDSRDVIQGYKEKILKIDKVLI